MPDTSLLVGKTISNAQRLQHKHYDDQGFILLTFTDGAQALIVSDYKGYTGKSEDEYQTCIYITEKFRLEDYSILN